MTKLRSTVIAVLGSALFSPPGALSLPDRDPDRERTSIIVREASGIVRLDEKLLIVCDDADGRYFEIDLEEFDGCVLPIDPAKVREISLPCAELATDIEAIDYLADGRIVVLSETLHSLIGRLDPGTERYGVIAEYGKTLIEFGSRGLEGLAVKRLETGESVIAVLWEGGYPIYGTVPGQLREAVGRLPMKPVILVHRIGRNEVVGAVRNPDMNFELDVPEPPGEPPLAQRLRATDLVWHSWHDSGDGKPREGFIVVLQSENSPPPESGIRTTYEIKILQRFDLEGNPVGNPLTINEICREGLKDSDGTLREGLDESVKSHIDDTVEALERGRWENINWEGLAWFEEGKSLIAIYDTWPLDPPFALIVEIPDGWH